MKRIDIDFEEVDFADEMIRAIENDYGRSIARIAQINNTGLGCFEMKIVFSDFKLLEAKVQVISSFGEPTVQIVGIYY